MIKGLVLSGGLSTRMQRDKGSLVYYRSTIQEDQRAYCYRLLRKFFSAVFISCREFQAELVTPNLPLIFDCVKGSGPGRGLLSAYCTDRNSAWFVLACDMPYVDSDSIQFLLEKRNPSQYATLFNHPDGLIEPLFGIWEPQGLQALDKAFQQGTYSLNKVLKSLPCQLVAPESQAILTNINSWHEYSALVQSAIPGNNSDTRHYKDAADQNAKIKLNLIKN